MEVGIGQRNTATLVGLSLFPDYFYVQSIVLEPCNCVQCYRLYGDVDELPYHQTTVRKRSGGYVVLTTRTCRHTVSLRTVVVVSARALNNCLPFSEPVDKALKQRPIRKLAKSHFCPRGSTGFSVIVRFSLSTRRWFVSDLFFMVGALLERHRRVGA